MRVSVNVQIFFLIFIFLTCHANREIIQSYQCVVDEKWVTNLSEIPEYNEQQRLDQNILTRLMPIPHDLPVDSISVISTYTPQEWLEIRESLLPSPAPVLSFTGHTDSLTTIPPDTQGTVGLNHIMTTLNDRVSVSNKMGDKLRTVSLSTFWGMSDTFDPRICYDPFDNRWIFTTLASEGSAASMILLAVSQTDNPLGNWNIFHIKADPTATTTSGVWADFPTLGFNGTWIVVQTNMFNITNGSFNRSHVYVFDKADLYANSAGTYRLFTLTNAGATQTPAVTYDSTISTLYLLQNWNGNANGNGLLSLYALNGSVGNETLSRVGFISIAAPWASFHPVLNGGFAPQLNSSTRIMNNDARMLSLVFRNGSLWAAHTVFLPASSPTHSAVQWLQIRPAGTIQQFGRIEDATATVSSGNFFAFPSIAVNANNDALIGYSFFNSSLFATSGFSFRAAGDTLNTLRGTTILKAGRDIYAKDFGSGEVRWGDYSSTIIDPNGVDFWTLQESAGSLTPNGVSRWLTWWGKVSPV